MRILKLTGTFLVLVISLFWAGATPPTTAQEAPGNYDELIQHAQKNGIILILVDLALPGSYQPEGDLPNATAVQAQRLAIRQTQQDFLNAIAGYAVETYAIYDIFPILGLKVDAAALQAVIDSPLVNTIQEDVPVPPSLLSSTAVIGAPAAWGLGYTGTGQAVVILDSGIDAGHLFFGGRVVDEACFSNIGGGGFTLCPAGGTTQTGAGAADATIPNCDGGALCDHGSHVAGIAAGADYGGGPGYSGVALGADIIAIQVFTRFTNATPVTCASQGLPSPCILSYTSDQISALQYVHTTLNPLYNIAAVNMSLGGGGSATACDSDSRKPAIDNLRSVGVATIIASGNDGSTLNINAPACISTAVAVGATTDADAIASFSNSNSLVDLLAPGVSIDSSVPGGAFANKQGTSMATPHVTGAWAVLKGVDSTATITDTLNALVNTGVNVTDSRNGVTKPRIQLDAAAAYLTSFTWTGNTTSWNDAANWSNGRIPNACAHNITIPAAPSGGNFPTIDVNTTVGNLTIVSGGQLSMGAANTLAVCGNLDVQANSLFNVTAITVDGTVTNNGAMSQSQPVTAVGSGVEFLHITDSGLTADKYFGVAITPTVSSLGTVAVTVKGNQTCTTNPGDAIAQRCFDIAPASPANASLRFYFTEAERNGQDANNLGLWHFGLGWAQVGDTYTYSEGTGGAGDGVTVCGTAFCWFQAENVNSFSPFVIGSGATPTAVTLQSFQAGYAGKEAAVSSLIAISLMFTLVGWVFRRRRA